MPEISLKCCVATATSLWGISTPGMIANSPKLIQEVWSDPLAAPGKFARGFVESFTGFSSTDMRASGRSTMNWILALTPVGIKGVGTKGAMGKGGAG